MLWIIRYHRGVQLNLPLQVGSRLENYRILRVLAAGGFSFVYLAHDDDDAPVVIKEYLPATLALRANGETEGSPLLIDFGAARQQFSAGGLKLPPSYTPGFAAPEQHTGAEPLGPWTDIYAVGATLYACFAAAEPQPADARLKDDRLMPARRAWKGKYSTQLLDTVDWSLKLS